MARNAFDYNPTEVSVDESIRPLWTIKDLDDAEKMLEWQNRTYDIECSRIQRYREQALRHLALFIGKFYTDQTVGGRGTFAEASQAGLGVAPQKVSKLVVNHLYDLVTQRVSRITRNKPTVSIRPANSEYSDKVSARIVQFWTDYLLYINDFDRLVAECAQAAYIMGEAYILSLWNANKGEVHQDWKDAEATAATTDTPPRIPLMNSKNEPVIGEDGQPLYIQKPVYTGEIELRGATPLNVTMQSNIEFHRAEYFFYDEQFDIDELRELYPDQAELIKADARDDGLDKWRETAGLPNTKSTTKCVVRHFYQKPNQFLAGGRYVLSTRTAVLENKPFPARQRVLPISRLSDIDIPTHSRGMSFFVHGKHINATINDLTSMMRRNSLMMAHPKWVYPRGSLVKKDALGNDITSIEYAGPTPPRIETPPPMSQELNVIRNDLKQDLQTILGVFDISRGQVPSNIRSAMALQLMDEQEEQRANSSVSKHAALIRDVIQKAINVASAYYEKDDKRLIPIVGKDNRWILKEFNPEILSKNYDVRVQNGSSLPTTKAARTEMLVELKKAFPNMFRDEQVAEWLQFQDTDKFFDAATIAVKAAEAENEAMLNEEDIEDPMPYENHVAHWTVHMREIQNRGFKTDTPPHVQAAFIAHVMATEMFMLQTARKNPAYSLELIQLPQFPAFFELNDMDRMLLDRARSGNPLTLVEISQLNKGIAPQGAGITPPDGGIPNPSAGQTMVATQGIVPPAEPAPSPQEFPGQEPGPEMG